MEHFIAIGFYITLFIFIIQFIGSFVGMDFDFEFGDFEFSDAFTFKGLSHFCLGFFSFMYFSNNYTLTSYAIAVFTGIIFACVLYYMYYTLRKLEHDVKAETDFSLVDREAEVYASLKNGKHFINVIINGSISKIEAYSENGKTYKAGKKVTITKVTDSNIYFK